MLEPVQALVRYHEIALKGRNRPFFVRRLARNLSRAASDLGRVEVRSLPGRLALRTDDPIPWELLRERIESVYGVANFSPVTEVARDLEQVKRVLVPALAERPERTFAVRTRRADKKFEMSSGEVERELGSAICAGTDLRVHLDAPEITVYVEIMKDRIYYCFDKIPGPGGMPVGTAGTVAALLSGGIDSPVAARRMMRRGCRVVFVHFHAFPLQDRTTIDKAMRLSELLTRYQYKSRLLLVPFGAIQQSIVAHAPAPLRVVLYRRFMIRIAEALVPRHRGKALVTGESLGQVASQTLDNISVIDAASTRPILRPLVGMDKQEITREAEDCGTFEISTLPDQDCCQLFVPRRPATAASLTEVERAEARLDVAGLVETAVRETERRGFRFPPREATSEEPEPARAEVYNHDPA